MSVICMRDCRDRRC